MHLDRITDLAESQPGDAPYEIDGHRFWKVNGRLRPLVSGGSEGGASDTAVGGSETVEPEPDEAGPEMTVEDLLAEVEKWKVTSRKHEGRAKANKDAANELARLKRDHATDDDKIRLDAHAAGKAEGRAEMAPRLLAARVAAAAGGRITAEAQRTLLDGLDATKFLTDDGDVDTDKVTALVQGIAPTSDTDEDDRPIRRKFPDLGQGRRRPDGGKPSVASGRDRFHERKGPKK